MKFVINRSKWRCGEDICTDELPPENFHGRGDTRLLNEEGFMCCLGQIGLRLGCKRKDILDKATPSEVVQLKDSILCSKGKYFGRQNSSELAVKAMDINDDYETTRLEKEKKLRALFRKNKHTVVFTGKYLGQKKKAKATVKKSVSKVTKKKGK